MIDRRTIVRLMCSVAAYAATPHPLFAQIKLRGVPQRDTTSLCDNTDLITALSLVRRSCTRLSCDFAQLRDLDNNPRSRAAILASLREPGFYPIHLFFENAKSDIGNILDWTTAKRKWVDALRFQANIKHCTVFVFGHASYTAPSHMSESQADKYNRDLSVRRMQTVRDYLSTPKPLPCADLRGAYMGRQILQLRTDDADAMGIAQDEYRRDQFVLNQAVHIFAVPCPGLIGGRDE